MSRLKGLMALARRYRLLRIGVSLLAAAVLTMIAASGLLYRVDSSLSDVFHQKQHDLREEITIVGIDARALDALGPWPWEREVMAMAIESLNSDPENRPAAIGLDVLYVSETDPDSDAYLAQVCDEYGNVVVATVATFRTETVELSKEDSIFYRNVFHVKTYEEPYDALKETTTQGHINIMVDDDGYTRHCLWQLDLPDGRSIPSLPYQMYAMYARHMGFAPDSVPPMAAYYQWYLSYSGKPGDYSDYISVIDVIEGDVPSSFFKDKIVLIGPYTAGLQDQYNVPIVHGGSMYGVEIMANQIAALLNKDFKLEAGDSWQLALLFLLSFAALLWFWDRKVLPAAIAWAAVTGGWLILAKALYSGGTIVHVLWLPAAITVLFIVTVAINYTRAALARRRVTATFMRYVAPEIVDEILKEGSDAVDLGGRLTDIAVLFVDIRGFTPMSEILEPTEVVEMLNAYLTLTSSCIMGNKGTLDKFIGDATMAFWGAPLPQEDYIYKAVKTAVDMVEGSRALSRELEEKYGRTVSFGIGIHCGKAVVGNIGAEMRMDYTAIGDTVNTAARLESSAPPGSIYISRAVADALEGRIRATPLGALALKGKAEGFEALELNGLV